MAEEQNQQLSFERLMGWLGHFTPQFKLQLMVMKKHLSISEFENQVKELFTLFRFSLIALSQLPKGPQRALWVFQFIDQELAQVSSSRFTCQKGCAACCRTFSKQITNDEADLLASVVKSGIEIDRDLLERQARQLKGQQTADGQTRLARTPCVFLGDDGACSVYQVRPSVCRKYHVTSPAEECSKENGEVVPHIEVVAEVITSAALSIPGNDFGWMAEKLWDRLQTSEVAEEETYA